MEGRVDRYASSRGEEAHRRGATASQQLDTAQRESTSVDKEMEGRVDRYASSRDNYARDSGKETSSTYDWKRRDRSSATQWSPPFTSSSSSVQDGSGRFYGGFDLPTNTSSPQPSPFSGASSLHGSDIVHDEASHMSPPKRPRPGWGEVTDSGHDEASHLSLPKRPRLGWGQGLAKYEKKKGTDGEDCSKSAVGAAKDENVKKSNSQSEEEISGERAAKPGSWQISSSSTPRSLLPEIGSDKFASPVESEVHKSDGSSKNSEQSNDTRQGSAVQGVNIPSSEVIGVENGPSGDPLTSQSSGQDPLLPKDPINTSCPQNIELSQDQSPQDSSHSRLVSGLPSDMSGLSKDAIAQQLLIVEAELEFVEKELSKLEGEDDGDIVDEAHRERSVQGVPEHEEHSKDDHGESPQESAAERTPARDTKASDLEVASLNVSDVTTVEVLPAPLVADEANTQVIEVQVLPSSVEESSISPPEQEAHTEASEPSKSDSDNQTLQDSDEQMPLTLNSEHCDSFSCACHGLDFGMCDLSDDEEELPVSNSGICGLSDLMFYRYVFSVWNLIMENRRLAKKANSPFQHLLLKDDKYLDFKVNDSLENTTVWIQNEERHTKIQEQMQEKLSERKKMLKFKERVLALKYRALKEDCYQGQVGSCQRRDRVKPVRRWEVERRNAANFAMTSSQRTTLRLRPVIAGPTRLHTADDAQTRRRLSAVTPINHLRQDLKMPAMILDEKERCSRRFLSRNGLVEDPIAFEQERKSINPWTEEEKALFMEKFPLFNKNFSKIASYFQHKTTADCIEFYYRNQKSEEFEKIKRRRQQLKKRRDYSLSGSFLATLTPSNSFGRFKDVNSSRVEALTLAAYAASQGVKASRGSSHKVVEKARPVSTYDSGNLDQLVVKSVSVKEIKSVSAEVKEIKAVSASDAATSGISPCCLSIGTPSTSKNCRDKLSAKGGSAFIPPCSKVVEEHGDRKDIRISPGLRDVVVENEDTESQWTDLERDSFLEAVSSYGKDFKSISERVVSKTPSQCRTFYSKIRKRYRLDIAEQAPESNPLDVGGSHRKSPADVKINDADDSPLENSKFTDLGTVGMQQDSNALEGMCKVEIVEGNEMEDGLRLLGEAVVNTLTDMPSGNDGDAACVKEACDAKEACEDDSATKSEDVFEPVAVVPVVDDQKQPEQIVKVEPETEVGVAENLSRVHKDVLDTCTVKDEAERVESEVVEWTAETLWVPTTSVVPAESTPSVDPCSILKAHEEDLGPGKVVVKAEPIVSLDSGGPSVGVPFVPSQHAVSVPVTSTPVTQTGPVRERGTRVNAAGEFKPRREPTSWTQEEKEKFAEIIRRHGKDWTLLDESLPGKSMTQIKTYFQNSKAKLGFLSTDSLANPGTRGSCNRKRKPEESDTSSNAGSAGQICPQKALPSEDVLQKVVSSSMMTISTSMGTSGVGADGMGYSHFNPGPCQPGEDAAARDLQKMIRRICSASEYGAQPNIVGGILPLFQPGVTASYPGPSSQQSLLLAAQKQQLMVGHPSAQQALPTQVGLQQQQQPTLTNHKQQQLISHVVQQLAQLQQQQQQQTNQLVVHQPQMVHQLQQLVQLQQQQQQHLAQVAKHIPPQLLHQQSHQHLPLGPNVVHQQQLVSRAKLAAAAAGVQQQVGHVSRLHPAHSQQQLFQQQQQILQQQKQQQLILQQIQATQLQHDLQLHQQMQAQKQQQQQQQQLPQHHHHHQQQQLQHGQPLALFRGPYQSALAEAELLRHSEVVEQRNTPAKLGLLPREDLQVQSQRGQQNIAQQPQPRAPPSSESQRLRMGDVKLFGQSLLSQPQPNSATPSMSSSHKTWQPVSSATTVPLAIPSNPIPKAFVGTEPSVLAPPAFNRPGGTALVEGSQSWPVGSAGNLDLWNSMIGGLQGALYKNEDTSKSEVCSVHEAVTKMTARLTRDGHELDGEDLHNATIGVINNDLQRSTEATGDIVRIGAADVSEVPNDGHLRVEGEWRNIPRPHQVGGYSQVLLDPHYTYSGERPSGNSQGDVTQTWDSVLERESSRNAIESGIGNFVAPALASEMMAQQLNPRGDVYAPLSLPLPPAAAVTKISPWSVSASLPHPGESVGGPFVQPPVGVLRVPEEEQPSSLSSDSKSKNVDNSGGPG